MRRLTYLLSALVVIVLAGVLSSVVTEGFRELDAARRERRRLEIRKDRLERRVAELERTIEALDSSPAAVEALARRELGWVRPGETVYLMTTPTPAAVVVPAEHADAEPVLSMPSRVQTKDE